MRAGIGSQYPTWEPLRQALEAHTKEAYGEQYVVQDFVAIAYVISLADDEQSEGSEYILATSTSTNHIVDGLLDQVKLFQESPDND